MTLYGKHKRDHDGCQLFVSGDRRRAVEQDVSRVGGCSRHQLFDLGYLEPNGSGKSTTVKMLTGLLQPTTGQVLFYGEDISVDPLRYMSRLGYVPDEPQLYGFLAGWECLEFIAYLRGINERQFQIKARELYRLSQRASLLPLLSHVSGEQAPAAICAAFQNGD